MHWKIKSNWERSDTAETNVLLLNIPLQSYSTTLLYNYPQETHEIIVSKSISSKIVSPDEGKSVIDFL